MRSTILCLALLHGLAMLAVAWRAFGDTSLSADQQSYGRGVLAIAGSLMLVGAAAIRRTPALASVPVLLAGMLTLSARKLDGWYLLVYGGWSIVLAVLAIADAAGFRPSELLPTGAGRRSAPGYPEPKVMDVPPGQVLRRVQRHRRRPRRHIPHIAPLAHEPEPTPLPPATDDPPAIEA